MLYNVDSPGDWGNMQTSAQVHSTTETLQMTDGCELFLRRWRGESQQELLLLHGLGAHSGWFIDMGNELAARGLSVSVVDHRGFGRSGGLQGHIERASNYIDDLVVVVKELRRRQQEQEQATKLFVLGHSMGGIFATHLVAKHGELLDGVLFLNPWVRDSAKVPLGTTLGIFGGGLLRSQRRWRAPGGTEVMTTNPEAARMLEGDPYWRRDFTANFWLEIFRMRLQVPALARRITLPALVMQAEQDRSVISAASRQLYDALGSQDKSWIVYPGYAHDSELESNRTQMDQDIVAWIQRHP